jgi:hypothetical protein
MIVGDATSNLMEPHGLEGRRFGECLKWVVGKEDLTNRSYPDPKIIMPTNILFFHICFRIFLF